MLKTLLLVLVLLQGQPIDKVETLQNSIGIAQNDHYIAFIEGGYYIEEDGIINENDIVFVSDKGDIYVIDNIGEKEGE